MLQQPKYYADEYIGPNINADNNHNSSIQNFLYKI